MKRTIKDFIALDRKYGAPNYAPLPVVLTEGQGAVVWDVKGKRYLDFLSAYSALSHGHNHPKIIAAAKTQLSRLSLTSRAFHNTLLGPFLKSLCALTGQDKALLMNSGAEAVETAIKAMRLWGYRVKGIPRDKAEIIVCSDNFHGRTTTIVGFSSDRGSWDGFGPKTPGFRIIPYGDHEALKKAITQRTCGFLVEPIQGEAGVRLPPPGYLEQVRDITRRKRVLFAADEIQTGLGRTGKIFCVDHSGVKPDLIILGKALGGGIYPVSAVASSRAVMDLFTPGTHGSTFGGNPLACAVGMAALDTLIRENLPRKAAELGRRFMSKLETIRHPAIKEVRGQGLLIGLELNRPARPYCLELLRRGLLAKDTHTYTIRLAPPLVITRSLLDEAFTLIAGIFASDPKRR